MSLIATTAERVPRHTSPSINQHIREQTRDRVLQLSLGGIDAIDARLEELDREWDIERCLETGAATLMLSGLALAATVDRRWTVLPAAVAAFLLQHALQGWCPPLPVFRRMGVRTADEINRERYLLTSMRARLSEAGWKH
jgi:hypothetical protein